MASAEDPTTQQQFAETILNPSSALTTAVEFIGEHLDPSDVFTKEKLDAWAKVRGYQLTEVEE